jgi:hypothetical protein
MSSSLHLVIAPASLGTKKKGQNALAPHLSRLSASAESDSRTLDSQASPRSPSAPRQRVGTDKKDGTNDDVNPTATLCHMRAS